MTERIDNTGFGDIKVIQNDGLGYGVDAVLLAAFAAGETGASPIRNEARVCDLGTGSGIVAFILAHKISDTVITGVELRNGAAERAKQAVILNSLTDRIEIVESDVKDYISPEKFDAVVSNPPYFKHDAAIPCETSDKYVARHETTADFGGFMKKASEILKENGDCYIVHRPDRLADIFSEMRQYNIEPKEMQLITPHPGEAANIVLVHGIKNAGIQLKMLPEIPVHNADGSYTEIIQRIYERV